MQERFIVPQFIDAEDKIWGPITVRQFVIVLAESDLESAKEVAERVRRAAENIKFTYRGEQGLMITVSMGVSQAKEGDTPEELLERADQALFEAKRAGRNRVVVA